MFIMKIVVNGTMIPLGNIQFGVYGCSATNRIELSDWEHFYKCILPCYLCTYMFPNQEQVTCIIGLFVVCKTPQIKS